MPEDEKSLTSEPLRKWFVAYVGTRAEKAVRDRLLEKGIEAFVAAQHEIHLRRSGRRVKIERPVITQYVFVHVTEEERRLIVELPYIHYFLTDKASALDAYGRHRLAVIPDRQMQVLRNMLSQDEAKVSFSTTGFSIGDEVGVLGWSDSVTGHIVRIHGDRSRYIGIRIDQLGCAYMEVSPDKLQKLGPNREQNKKQTKE